MDARARAMPRVIGGRYGLSSKEFTPGHGRRRVRGAGARAAAAAGSRSASTTTSPARACPTTRRSTSSARRRCARSSTGSARTARSARTRTRSRSSADERLHAQGYFVYDSKKSGCADGLAPALRAAADPGAVPRPAGELRRLPPVRAARAGRRARPGGARRDVAAQLPALRRTQVWDALPRPVQEQIIDKRLDVYAIDAGRSPARSACPGGSTPSCRPASSRSPGCCRASEAIERIKEAIGKTYGRRGAEVVERNEAAVDGTLAALHRIEVPARPRRTRELPPLVPAHAPEFVRTVTAEMMAGRGDDLPVSALPVDGTYPSGTTAYEKRNISELVAVWDPELCIQCGNCSFVCPHSVIRSKYYEPGRLEGAPDGVPVGAAQRARPPGHPLHAAGLRRGLHRLRAVRRGLPGEGAGRPGPQGDQPRAARAAAGAGARQHRVLRDAAGQRPLAGRLRHRARHPVPGAAVRVLRRLRRLRRDALHQAALAAVRRPADRRQRDRLLLDLRRQPADHAVDDERRRARAGLVELAVRGQRRVRPRLPARRRPAHRAGAPAAR